MRRAIILAILFFSGFHQLKAAHLKGGYIEYKYLGQTPGRSGYTSYKITVYQYLDCNSAGGQIDESVTLGIFDAASNQLRDSSDIKLTHTDFIQKKSFVCIDNPPVVCYRIDSYSATISLMNNTAGYILSVQRCCRIAGINNVSNSSNTGVTYTVNIYPSATSSGFLVNSSPIFAQEDTALVCARNGFTFPFKAVDPEGDSLVYKFSPGLNTPSREAKPNPPLKPPFPNLVYTSNFNAEQPLGSQVSINSSTGIISGIAPGAAGDYVVAVVVEEYRNGLKIAETRKELHLAVGTCNIPRAILPEKIINCNDFSVQFENQSFASGINAYAWDFGVTNSDSDTSSLPKPVFTYSDTGVYVAKLVVNPGGFCPDSIKTEVRIFPGFKADFDYKGICTLLPYQFIDRSKSSYGVINKYHWDFGDPAIKTDTSNLKNPSWLYDAVNSFPVTLFASSTKGCTDSISKTVIVSDKPVINVTFRDTVICAGDSVQLNAGGPGNYTWSPAINLVNPNSATPTVFPKTNAIYYVELNNSGCSAKDSVSVRVVNAITVDAGNDTTICSGDPVMLHPISAANRYQWSPATGLDNPNAKTPVAVVTATSATYSVNASLGSCKAAGVITITTQPYPVVNAGFDTTVCFGQGATLRGNSNGKIIEWQPADKVRNSKSIITITTAKGTQPFILVARFDSGCTKPVSDTVVVTVLTKITAFAGNDTSLVIGQSMILNGVSNATDFTWSPATGLSNSRIINPELSVSPDIISPGLQFLRYTLVATAGPGCQAADDILIRVFEKPFIYVPSGFTPNSDGLNDVIRPVLAGIKTFGYFRIYNRYGQLIFETGTPGVGWNGSIKGQPQAAGVYVYDCQATDYTGQPRAAKGTVVLVR